MRRSWPIASIALAISVSGCTSFKSTMLNRLDDNSFVGNSNGMSFRNNATRPFKGVPVTLQVPSHLDVFIDEVVYLTHNGDQLDAVNTGRLLNVRTQIVKTKKVVFVDFKRPGSGTLELDTKFSDQQYFTSIDSKLTDTTIKDSAALVAQAASMFSGTKASAGDQATPPKYFKQSRVVAYKRFDINEPDYEQQLEAFVETHLNQCDSCEQSPLYDSNPTK